MKEKTIDKIIILGREYDSCIFSLTLLKDCYISKVKCRYGLTETKIPKNCPLRSHSVKVEYFPDSLIEIDPDF